jgi:hypothetical protein
MRKAEIESGAGRGRKIYLCRLLAGQDGIATGWGNFINNGAFGLTIKMTVYLQWLRLVLKMEA